VTTSDGDGRTGSRRSREDHGHGHSHEAESLLPVAEALAIVRREAVALGTEDIPLDEALGRALAEDVVAPEDMPALDRSAMDGFAVRSEDVARVPVELKVAGFLGAGQSADGVRLAPGEAVRIMTGAPVPAGADAVLMVERTEAPPGGERVRVLSSVAAGENIRRRGEDVRRGDLVLRRGDWIRPAEIGALAAVGKVRVLVHAAPRVTILSTGDEIVDPSHAPLPHQVRNSNGPALRAALADLGATARLATARDEPADLDRAIAAGLGGDLLLLIGGVSVGDRDFVSERLRAADVEVLFHRIAMKPGKPLLFGRRGGCLVFGLPGNPLSSMTVFFVFVVPALRRLMGLPAADLPEVSVRLTEPIRQKPGRTWYRLARVCLRDGRLSASPSPSISSGDMVSAARANGFLIVPSDASELPAGSEQRALLWPGFELRTADPD
jgi:molybdopterin molybdotransferase